MTTHTDRGEAIAGLVGALCHALLRVFHLAADAALLAPTMTLADRQTTFALEEMERYRGLREHLATLTDDPEAAMLTFRSSIDAFYDAARAGDWLENQVFTYVGATITTDFAELLAPRLEPETAEAIRVALAGRTAQEVFALEQILDTLGAEGASAQERVAHFAGTMVGAAINKLRGAVLESASLETVLGGEAAVKELVLEMLGRHRERLVRLGLDTLD